MLHVPEEHEAFWNASLFFLIQCSFFLSLLFSDSVNSVNCFDIEGGVGLLLPLESMDWLMICTWVRVIWWLSIWRWGCQWGAHWGGGSPFTLGVPSQEMVIILVILFFKLMVVGMTVGGWGNLGGQIGHSKCVLIEKG